MSILLFAVTSLAEIAGHSAAEDATAGANDTNQEMVSHTTKLVAAVRQINPGRWSMKIGGSTAAAMMDDQGEMGGMGMPDDQMGAMPPSGGSPTTGMPPSGSGGGMKDGKMGGMSGMAPGSAGMPSGGGSMAPQAGCCMGEMGAMGGAQPGGMAGMPGPSSAMPGNPGISHLYHIGSTGFFLDHPQHITLTPEQKMALSHLKEKALLDRMTQQRRIDQAEQDLYTLTGIDQLDEAAIQTNIAEIEKLRGERRMHFIRAVVEAANVLNHDQHLALMGVITPKRK